MEFLSQLFNLFLRLIDFFIHLDVHLNAVIQTYGTFTYAILFFVVFCETGKPEPVSLWSRSTTGKQTTGKQVRGGLFFCNAQ